MGIFPEGLLSSTLSALSSFVLPVLLLGAGVFFTWRTRGVQVRLFGRMLRQITRSRSGAEGGISSFQAFAVGLASRVGTGNIAGVAIALTLGGPGAVFWMWVVAAVGMATAFIEASLAQVYKVPSGEGSFRGGPAYYIQRGLGSRGWGIVFAVLLLIAYGTAFNMVQANTIADVVNDRVDAHWVAVILIVCTTPIIFGGIRRVSRAAEVVLPVMAGAYVLMAGVVILLNLTELPGVLGSIVGSAFGIGPAAAGVTGGVVAAMSNGVNRGLFSNEAGMGSAPNAAATATTSHPAKQGLVQSLGVFVDTMLVCTATAMAILLASPSVYDPGTTTEAAGAQLTQAAMVEHFGQWAGWAMAVLTIAFAFSSILGNYVYGEINLDFLGGGRGALNAFRVVLLASIGIGSVLALTAVWALADNAMALMAIVNLVAILKLSRWGFAALTDYERQYDAGQDPTFRPIGNDAMPGELLTEAWVPTGNPA